MTPDLQWLWIAFPVLVALAGLHRLLRRRARRAPGPPRVDDEAIDRILRHGTLEREDEPLDEEEIARAEEEFWEESWDEPEEYGR